MKELKYFLFVIFSFVIIICFFNSFKKNEHGLLYSSGDVKVYNISEKNIEIQEENLKHLSESEIINDNLSIYRGVIKKIDNIEINFKNKKKYAVIIHFYVTKTISGDSENGNSIKVLLPNYNFGIVNYEDSKTISRLKKGVECVIMPYKYTNDDLWEYNHKKLILCDIAEYGLLDKERYIFASSENEIIYCESAFPSLNNVKTLEQVELFIKSLN